MPTRWSQVAEVPQDGDTTYLEPPIAGRAFNVGVQALTLAARERIAAVAGAVCWRNLTNGVGRLTLALGAQTLPTADHAPAPAYDTGFVLARTSPVTGAAWTAAEASQALVGAVSVSGPVQRATQVGLHVFVYTPPAVPPTVVQRHKEIGMNFRAIGPLVANGSDQEIEVPRGATLVVHPVGAAVEVRDVAGADGKLTIPADALVMLGPSNGQTVYLKADADTVIELAVT